MTRKSSAPTCRVCGCTEHNACEEGCSWVKVEAGSPKLCSACSGTAADMVEAVKRGITFLSQRTQPSIDSAIAIGRAAIRRRDWRAQEASHNLDPAWGGR